MSHAGPDLYRPGFKPASSLSPRFIKELLTDHHRFDLLLHSLDFRLADLGTILTHLATLADLPVSHSPLLPFPKSRLLVPAPNESVKIERVKKRPQEPSRILIPRAHDLRHAIPRKVQLRALGQILSRMPEIPQPRIGQHHRRLKHIKEPLIPDLGPQRHRVEPGPNMQLRGAPVLDDAIHRPHRDQRAARVQRTEHRRQLLVADARRDAPPVEGRGEGDEQEDDDDLDEQRGLEERFAGLLAGGRQRLVGGARGADAGEGLDGRGDEGEGGQDAAWVDGREVRDVEEDAAEDLVVGEFVEWSAGWVGQQSSCWVSFFGSTRCVPSRREVDSRCGIYQDNANNELHQIPVIERRELPRDEAAREQQPRPAQDARRPPAFVMAAAIVSSWSTSFRIQQVVE